MDEYLERKPGGNPDVKETKQRCRAQLKRHPPHNGTLEQLSFRSSSLGFMISRLWPPVVAATTKASRKATLCRGG